jgi:hypothetical protein
MVALFTLALLDAAARYVTSRHRVAGWSITLALCPCLVTVALVVHLEPAAFLAVPWAIAASLNIRAARRDQAPAALSDTPAE